MKTFITALLLVSSQVAAADPVRDAAAKDRANDLESYCKATARLAKAVVKEVRDDDPVRTKYWLDQIKSNKGTGYADVIADAYLYSSYMGPLETEAQTYQECKKGKYKPNRRK